MSTYDNAEADLEARREEIRERLQEAVKPFIFVRLDAARFTEAIRRAVEPLGRLRLATLDANTATLRIAMTRAFGVPPRIVAGARRVDWAAQRRLDRDLRRIARRADRRRRRLTSRGAL